MKTVSLHLRQRTLSLIGCIALSSAAGAQSKPPAPSELVIRATTRMVAVDVVVTDRDGHPVTGLTKNDFTVIEDSKPQTISTFSASSPPLSAWRQGLPPLLPPHVTTNPPDVIECDN